MGEQEVRDAYMLAARAHEGRANAWERHALPLPPQGDTVWLTVAGLPLGPMVEVFDPRSYQLTHLTADSVYERMRAHAECASLTSATNQLRYWSDGVFGNDDYDGSGRATNIFRLHRDGTAMIATQFGSRLSRWNVPRALNAQLAYLGWLWDKLGIRTPIEIDARLVNLYGTTIAVMDSMGMERVLTPNLPDAGPGGRVEIRREVLVDDLNRAGSRHELVKAFSDRLHQAFGIVEQPNMFTQGWLYGRDGDWSRISLAGRAVRDETGAEITFVDKRGGILSKAGDVVAWTVDGVVLDSSGHTLAMCELAVGGGVGDGFVAKPVVPNALPKVIGRDPGVPTDPTHDLTAPPPTGEWSPNSLQQLIDGR